MFRRQRKSSNAPNCVAGKGHGTNEEELHRLASCGKFGAIVDLVSKFSTPEDWLMSSTAEATIPTVVSVGGNSTVGEDVGASNHPNLATTPLHLILTYQPPVAIVHSMIQVMRDQFSILSPEEFPDKDLKTPLHIAVEHFCDPQVIERLLAGDSLLVPALLRDRLGRCPLHYNCCMLASATKRKKFYERNPAPMNQFRQRQTLAILLDHYPEAAGLEDVYGKTPWDYAQETKLKGSNVQLLERMYETFVVKPPKKLVRQITGVTSISIEDGLDDDISIAVRSLSCSQNFMDQMDDDVSSIGSNEVDIPCTPSTTSFNEVPVDMPCKPALYEVHVPCKPTLYEVHVPCKPSTTSILASESFC